MLSMIVGQGAFVVIPEISLCDISYIIKKRTHAFYATCRRSPACFMVSFLAAMPHRGSKETILSESSDAAGFLQKRKKTVKRLSFIKAIKNRQRPTFPGSFPPSIIGAKELNFCVRDGNRCDLLAIVTGFSACGFLHAIFSYFVP